MDKEEKREGAIKHTIISKAPRFGLGAGNDIRGGITLLAGPPALILGDGSQICRADSVLGGRVDRNLCHVNKLHPGLHLGILGEGDAVDGWVSASSDRLVHSAAGGSGTLLKCTVTTWVSSNQGQGESERDGRGQSRDDFNHDG